MAREPDREAGGGRRLLRTDRREKPAAVVVSSPCRSPRAGLPLTRRRSAHAALRGGASCRSRGSDTVNVVVAPIDGDLLFRTAREGVEFGVVHGRGEFAGAVRRRASLAHACPDIRASARPPRQPRPRLAAPVRLQPVGAHGDLAAVRVAITLWPPMNCATNSVRGALNTSRGEPPARCGRRSSRR